MSERNFESELRAVMDGLSESIAEAAAEDLVDDCRTAGTDPLVVLSQVKHVLRAAVKDVRQRPLKEARGQYEERRAQLTKATRALPDSAEERHNLLAQIFASHPPATHMLTAQYRDFEGLEDEDISSCLIQLAALGFLDGENKDPDDHE